jgi:hypothetical protein
MPGTTEGSSGTRTACLLSCRPLKWASHCSELSAPSAGPAPRHKPMQVRFAEGGGSPCSHAKDLACNAQVCRSLQTIAWGLGEPAQTNAKAQQIGAGDCANPGLAKRAGGACAMGPKHSTTSRAALALHASLPQTETWSCSTRTLPTDEPTDLAELRRSAKARCHKLVFVLNKQKRFVTWSFIQFGSTRQVDGFVKMMSVHLSHSHSKFCCTSIL